MTLTFRYEPKPARVVFGAGQIAAVAQAVTDLGCRRAFILSTAGQSRLADLAAEKLGDMAAGVFCGAVMHTPVEVTSNACTALDAAKADCIVAIGGGSTIGLGKAIALRTDLPQVAIPTTYAGSEMTDIIGETKDGAKVTQRTLKVLPEIVVYDVELTLDLPVSVSAASGMNAIAHAVEALYAPDGNPAVDLMAEEGIRRLAQSLPTITSSPRDIEARTAAQLGAWLCGLCLASAAMALHHKICHALGGMFNLPHAATHAIMLPHTAHYNAAAAPKAMAAIGRALGTDAPAAGLHRLKEELVGKLSLANLGMPQDGIERASRSATANPYPNPKPIEYGAIRDMLAAAHRGAAPGDNP